MTLPSRRQWAIAAGFLGCLLAALAIVGWLVGAPLAGTALPGVAVGFLLTLQRRSRRAGLIAVAVMGGLAFVSTLAASSTAAAALWMGAVGFAYGLSALRGWHVLTQQLAIWCAYVTVNPLQAHAATKLSRIEHVQPDLRAALVTAAVVVASGAFAALLAGFAKGTPRPLAPLGRDSALLMAIAMGVLLGVGTLIVVGGYRHAAGEWLLLTMIVVSQPDVHGTYRHTLERVVGTVAGVLAAGVIGLALGDAPVRSVLAIVLLVAAFAFRQVPGRYWPYVLFLTPGIVLIESQPSSTAALAENRLLYTLAGAAAVTAAALAVSALTRRPSA